MSTIAKTAGLILCFGLAVSATGAVESGSGSPFATFTAHTHSAIDRALKYIAPQCSVEVERIGITTGVFSLSDSAGIAEHEAWFVEVPGPQGERQNTQQMNVCKKRIVVAMDKKSNALLGVSLLDPADTVSLIDSEDGGLLEPVQFMQEQFIAPVSSPPAVSLSEAISICKAPVQLASRIDAVCVTARLRDNPSRSMWVIVTRGVPAIKGGGGKYPEEEDVENDRTAIDASTGEVIYAFRYMPSE